MSNNRRHGSGRLLAVAAVALAAAALAPIAHAQDAASVTLTPEIVAPGANLTIVFRAPAFTLDLALQERVDCTIRGADGEAVLCDWQGALLSVRLLPDGTERIFVVRAPDVEGEYELTVTRSPYAGTPLAQASASATLVVRAPAAELAPEGGEPLTPGVDAGGPSGGGATVTNFWNIFLAPGARDDPESDADDAARWMVSSTAGTAALVLLLVGSRGGLGGTP